MSYYPTLEEDVKRAKEILERGRVEDAGIHYGGTIYGADLYAAYSLLASFVEAIEAVGPKVAELALRHDKRMEAKRGEQTR